MKFGKDRNQRFPTSQKSKLKSPATIITLETSRRIDKLVVLQKTKSKNSFDVILTYMKYKLKKGQNSHARGWNTR